MPKFEYHSGSPEVAQPLQEEYYEPQLRNILAGFTVQETNDPDAIPIMIPAGELPSREALDIKQHEAEYQADINQEIRNLQLRLTRLKIRLLKLCLLGSYSRPQIPEQAKVGLLNLSRHKRPIAKKNRLVTLTTINAHLNPQQKLHFPHGGLTAVDMTEIKELASNMLVSKTTNPHQLEILNQLLATVYELEKKLAGVTDQSELIPIDINGRSIKETKLAEIFKAYRDILKITGPAETQDTWFSPTYGQSITGQIGQLQTSRPFSTDYQRWLIPEITQWEDRFAQTYLESPKGPNALNCVLINSGMSTFEILKPQIGAELQKRKSLTNPALPASPKIKAQTKKEDLMQNIWLLQNFYEEIEVVLRTDYPEMKLITIKQDETALARGIMECKPPAVILTPLTNSPEMHVFDIQKVLTALAKANKTTQTNPPTNNLTTYLIIDNSTASRLGTWKNFNFATLPAWIKVVGFESLVKYAQDGQDLTQAGIIYSPDRTLVQQLKTQRGSMGLQVAETNARALQPSLFTDILDDNLQRQSRNAQQICRRLSANVNFIQKVNLPDIQNSSLKNTGGLFTLQLNFNWFGDYSEHYRHKTTTGWDKLNTLPFNKQTTIKDFIARAFMHTCILLARQAGIELNAGTSYGFHTARLAIYRTSPATGEANPYVRFSAGSENIKNALLIGEIIKRAEEIFNFLIKERQILLYSQLILDNSSNSQITFNPAGE